ncbi:GtrA family protein [Longispora urticae]
MTGPVAGPATDSPAAPAATGLVARLIADRRVRYVAAGGIAAVVFYGTFSGTWLLFGGRVPYLAAVLVANIVTALVTYPIYRRSVFVSSGPYVTGFLRFYAVSLWSLAYNLVALPLLVEVLGVPVLIAQGIVIVTGPLINYQIHRLWAFK